MSVTAPVSLFTDMQEAKRTPSYLSNVFTRMSGVTLPSESTAILPVGLPIFSSVSIPSLTDECSAAEEIIRPRPFLTRFENKAVQLDSVPPEVKNSVSGGTRKTAAHLFRASSRASFAALPSACCEDGFP